MNAPLLPEVLLSLEQDPQTHLELATDGVLRYVWESRWGPLLIEVKDGRAFVNGQRVEPFANVSPAPASPAAAARGSPGSGA